MAHKLIEPIMGGETPTHLIIAVDFDGTICQHPGTSFPAIGTPVPYATKVLKRIQEAGHKIMLWTMRDEKTISPALSYLDDNGIVLWDYNCNPDQVWSESAKQYAHLYIDDAALGCPLAHPSDGRAFVNWFAVEQQLIELKVLTDTWSSEKVHQIAFTVNGELHDADSVGDTVDEAIERLIVTQFPAATVRVHSVDWKAYAYSTADDSQNWVKEADEWPQRNPEDAIWKAEADAEEAYLKKVEERGYM